MTYGTRKFIAVVTNIRHCILSWTISTYYFAEKMRTIADGEFLKKKYLIIF